MATAAPAPRGPSRPPAAPSVLRRILAQRQAARERLRRSCLLTILFHAVLLLALLPLSLPSLRAQRASARIEITRVFVEPLAALATARPGPPEAPPDLAEVEAPAPPVEADRQERDRLEYVRAHLDPTAAPAPDDARISTQDQAVTEEQRAHARLHADHGSAASGEREAADQAAARASGAPTDPQPRREPAPASQAREALAAAEPRQPPEPATPARPETATASQRAAWEPIAARFGAAPAPDSSPERPAPPAPVPQLADAGGARAPATSNSPPPVARPSPVHPPVPGPIAPSEPEIALEEHVPTFLVDPVALARAEHQAQAAHGSETAAEQARRDVGSARAAASPSQGALAAAPATLVSTQGPPTVDLQTALATRDHPLAQALEALDDALRAAWSIPVDVRVSGIVGTTGVAFVIDRRGLVTIPAVFHPSGHERLDALALAAVPQRVRGFRHLLAGEARDAFPAAGLRVEYRFVYEDSPIGSAHRW